VKDDKAAMAKFLDIASALSPENLHCDGEISNAEARRKERALRAQWRALEVEIGRKVYEGEVWAWYMKLLRGR